MGVSTDAFLFYGLCLEEEGVPEWLGGDVDTDAWDDADEKVRKFGCTLATHCSLDYPMVCMAAGDRSYDDDKPSAFYVAWHGDPTKIGEKLPDTTGWAERITKAADAIGWPKDQRNIGWWLASNWA